MLKKGPSTAYDNGSTPTGFRNKRRFQEPIVQLGSESKVSSISDMDLDVDIFPTSLKSKKAKQTKTSNVRSKVISVYLVEQIYMPVYWKYNCVEIVES